MNNKIGRNAPCPCGSGKKNKKCHNVDRWGIKNNVTASEPGDTVGQYIKTHDSKHILNEIISLQLLPENHGKNIRIERLALIATLNFNSGKEKDIQKFHDLLQKEYSYEMDEDPAENLYTENVIFFGGNFTVFSGIALEPVEIFKNLSHIIFNTDINLPDEFRAQVYQGITLLLNWGEQLASRSGLKGNMDPQSESGQLVHNSNLADYSVSKSELVNLCRKIGIDPSIINNFILSADDTRFENDDSQFNPLLFYPIVQFNDEYFFLLVSNQMNAINEFILRLSKQYSCEKELLKAYQEEIWAEVRIACSKIGWAETDIEPIESKSSTNCKEAILHFDHNRLAYVALHTPAELSDLFDNDSSRNNENRHQRAAEVINDLKNRPEFLNTKFLTLSLHDSVGRFSFGMAQKPQKRELKLSFSAYTFIALAEGEDWSELSLWKFAKASDIFLKKNRSFSAMIDLYNIYKSKGESFYFSDEVRPDYVMLAPGEGSELVRQTKHEADYHAAEIRVDGQIAYMPVTKIADFAPIYKPTRHIGYFLQVLETYAFPLWITNRQVKNDSMVPTVRLYADAIAFWLHKFRSSLRQHLDKLGSHPLEIEIILEPAAFRSMTSLEMKEHPKGNYKSVFTDQKIRFSIPFSSFEEFIGSNNQGERKMMKEVLKSLNLIKDFSITDQQIDTVIELHMPLNQAKMILFSDAQKDLMIEVRWLFKTFMLTNAEIEILLDELPGLIETKMEIPQKIIGVEQKKALFNTAVNVLIEKLNQEIVVFNQQELLVLLLELHESVVQKREYNKTIIPAQLLCFGEIEVKEKEIYENEKKLTRTSVALRSLIEYLAAKPINGDISPGLDDVDRLLALMQEIVNFGFMSDAVHFKMDDPEVGKLPSGRLGISKDFLEDKLKPYALSNTKADIDDYISNFDNRFEIYTPNEQIEEDPEIIKSVEELDEAFLKDWGIAFSNLYGMFYCAAEICMLAETSVITMSETELIQKLVNDYKLPENQVVAGINQLVLSSRDSYLKAPEGFSNNEVFPWKYNREFSLTRRFFIRHTSQDQQILLSWGFRTAIAAQKQLQYLLQSGKLNNGGVEINRLMGAFRGERGKNYRNSVKDWLEVQPDFIVIEYEVPISPSGPLVADKSYGDVDVLALHKPSGKVFSIECKNTAKAKNIHEMKTEMDNYLGKDGGKGMITKHIARHEWLVANSGQLKKLFKTETVLSIKSLMLSSEVIPTPYIRSGSLPMPILAFHDLKREGAQLLLNM